MTSLRLLGDITECITCNQQSIVPLHCTDCGSYQCISHLTYIDNAAICPTCTQRTVDVCDVCEELHILEVNKSDQKICKTCIEDYRECDRCGNYEHADDIHCDDNIILCEHCYDRYYFTCESCDSITHIDDANSVCGDRSFCSSCADCHNEDCSECNPDLSNGDAETLSDHTDQILDNGARAIVDYHPSIDWEYYPDYKTPSLGKESDNYYTHRLFGIELEIEHKQSSNMHETCRLLAKSIPNRFIASHDGSLNSTGYEIVITPHGKEEFRQLKWNEILKGLSKHGALSHDTPRCGFHIHLNRKLFKHRLQTERYQELFNTMRNLLFPFSRRTNEQCERFCDFKLLRYHRYCAVNLSPENTIEVRLWRGTLNYQSFMACLDMSLALIDFLYAYPMAYRFNYRKAIKAFIDWLPHSHYHKLNNYLKSNNYFGAQ